MGKRVAMVLRCENLLHDGFSSYGYFEDGRQYQVDCVVDRPRHVRPVTKEIR